MPERRTGTSSRRTRSRTDNAERRSEERRDYPRRAIRLSVREPGGRSWTCAGDLSVSGASFITTAPPAGEAVELTFELPTYDGPITASGCVVGRTGVATGTLVSVAFSDIDVDAQLAIAQWSDEASGAKTTGTAEAATSPL